MKKIYYNNNEIALGTKIEVMVTPDNMAKLAKAGYIDIVIVPTDIDLKPYEGYIEKIASERNISKAKVTEFIQKSVSIGDYRAVFELLLKEIALEADAKYSNHIKESGDTVYVFSVEKGKAVEIPTSSVRSWNNFAAFRNIEDVREACHKLKPFIREMYERK